MPLWLNDKPITRNEDGTLQYKREYIPSHATDIRETFKRLQSPITPCAHPIPKTADSSMTSYSWSSSMGQSRS